MLVRYELIRLHSSTVHLSFVSAIHFSFFFLSLPSSHYPGPLNCNSFISGPLLTPFTDLAEHNKPWRLPGADQSDYFNYGFDEFTWEMYRQKQAAMSQTLQAQKAETAQFQQMFGGLGAGMPGGPSTATSGPPTAGVPGAPTGPSAQQQAPQGAPDMAAMAMSMGLPPGGPTPDQMMAYMQQMQAQGISPENMDFGQFMSAFAGAQGGGFGPGGQGGFPGGPGGGGQFGGPGGGQRGGRRGRGW